MEYNILQRLILLLSMAFCNAAIRPRDGYYGSSRNSDGCALRLDRSFSHRPTNPLADYGDDYETAEPNLHECIRYSDVNRAFSEAKKKMNRVNTDRNYYDMTVAALGEIAELLVETTKILARRFRLSAEDINEALPTIDTSQTNIWRICPDAFKPMSCRMTRFRTPDGSCSSIRNSVWGTSNSAFRRVLQPTYQDGINSAKKTGFSKAPLPNVRVVSVNIHQDLTRLDNPHSGLLMSWAQFVGDDLSKQGALREKNGTEFSCCPKKSHPICAPINIPVDDPFYSRFGQRCMEFQRTLAAIRPGCALGPRIQMNQNTARIDGSFLYGPTVMDNQRMRLGSRGLLKSWDKFRDLKLKELLPPHTQGPEKDCIARPKNLYCFASGDDRVNIQPDIVVLNTIFIRMHNDLAKKLAYLNPHWNDERLYQESRHIVIALFQHVSYNEYIPMAVGLEYARAYNLTLENEGYWYGYDENTPMMTLLPFQTAAYRFAHSMVHNRLRLYNTDHEFVQSEDFHEFIQQPYFLYRPGSVDKVIAGFLNAPPEKRDRYMASEVSQHLFEAPTQNFGRDLASLNINRGRDHGIPGYNDYREWCGLPRIRTFEELEYHMLNRTGHRYSLLYKHPDDIDLWSAGLAERNVEGGIVGPTLACIISRQFNILRKADHFWYENPGFPSSFTPGQLREIKKMTIAKIVCDNSDNIQTLQRWPLYLPDPKGNPRVHCQDLLSMNLEYWTEDPEKQTFLYS